MNTLKKIMIIGLLFLFVAITWLVAITHKSPTKVQEEFVATANVYLEDKVYVDAASYLEQACAIETELTAGLEEDLKQIYLNLIDQNVYKDKYEELLVKQMSDEDVQVVIFTEAADYYMSEGDLDETLKILIDGIAKTNDQTLIDYYEKIRYDYSIGKNVYENIDYYGGSTLAVEKNGFWGTAYSNGNLIIPCIYDKASAFYGSGAVVLRDGEYFVVDTNNNRRFLAKDNINDFEHLSEGYIPVKIDNSWTMFSSSLSSTSISFEEMGALYNQNIAVKKDGKWGLYNPIENTMTVNSEYDRIIMDEQGRAYGQNAVFVENGGKVQLIVNGAPTENYFEDAKPFTNSGYAAVKNGGKWGFINSSGEVVIDYSYEDAKSFLGHLAPVKIDGLWGYISIYGVTVIEPQFIEAYQFYKSSAPVKVEEGYKFITLYEIAENIYNPKY